MYHNVLLSNKYETGSFYFTQNTYRHSEDCSKALKQPQKMKIFATWHMQDWLF